MTDYIANINRPVTLIHIVHSYTNRAVIRQTHRYKLKLRAKHPTLMRVDTRTYGATFSHKTVFFFVGQEG